jgi:hypothetical protein
MSDPINHPMHDSTSPPPADAFGLGLPEDWEALPLEDEGFDRFVKERLASLAEAGVPVPERRRFELLTRQVRSLLLSEGAVYAAKVLAVLGEPDEIEEAELLTAAAVVTSTSRTSMGAPVALTTDLLLRGVTSSTDGDEGRIDLDPPRRMTLPAGKAVRLARLHRGADGNGQEQSVAQSYLVPFDEGERLCTLQLVTPNVAHGGEFSELFDGIARTLRIFREGEPTELTGAGHEVPADGDTGSV